MVSGMIPVIDMMWWAFAAGFVAVALGAAFQSSAGLGFGLLVSPVFALIDPMLVPSAVLLIGISTAAMATWRVRDNINWTQIPLPIATRFVGIICGVIILAYVADERATVSVVFGFLVLFAVAITGFQWHIRPTPGNLIAAGYLSGLMSAMVGIGGPPMGLVYQRSAAKDIRAMLNAFFAIGTLMSIIVLTIGGFMSMRHVIVAACFYPAMAIGLALAGQLDRFSDAHIRLVILAICTVASVVLIGRGLV